MTKYLAKLREETAKFEEFRLEQIPREQNMMADQLAKLASSNQFDGEKANNPAIGSQTHEGLLPEDSKEAGKIKLRSARFVMIDGACTRGISSPLLKCLNPDKAEYVLREVHEESCGNHSGARSLARKVLRLGYYWPTMVKDALSLVQKCSSCQRHANYQHNPAAYMKTLESPCPFDMWGMDIVGKLPRATGQREYLIVAVDYFTKWVEAEPLAKIGEKEVMKFIWQNIICRFGIPRVLIADNGTQFQGGKLKSWLEELKIKQLFTSVNNPQANGQAEVTNRIILQQLKTWLEDAKETGYTNSPESYGHTTPPLGNPHRKHLSIWFTEPKPYSS
ncbi:UNVERIFIED_CONTAM: Gag-Pol polyprotein [Sesamum latifolium]|uniref:Gag-Pol polyprotein n=1 Tax=Sesamum latifolium TaxID=2727402 RepID=A0AAW2VAL5_9LAMI